MGGSAANNSPPHSTVTHQDQDSRAIALSLLSVFLGDRDFRDKGAIAYELGLTMRECYRTLLHTTKLQKYQDAPFLTFLY